MPRETIDETLLDIDFWRVALRAWRLAGEYYEGETRLLWADTYLEATYDTRFLGVAPPVMERSLDIECWKENVD